MNQRLITSHKANGLNEAIDVIALDGATAPAGASHDYQLIMVGSKPPTEAADYVILAFQNGPIKEVGVNGISNESLLAVLIDRLQGFQSGEFKCRENALALTKLEEAMHWLHHRTRERMQRGVEGTLQK